LINIQLKMITSLAVFCGSKNGINGLYAEHAEQLGKLMAENNLRMIYGGGRNGIMGVIADAVMKHKGKVTGIIPHLLIEWESQHESITELLIAEDMHIRKKKMYELCDAAIILPGGFGTLDELFEMLTWNQLSIHDKKIFLLNSAGFFDHLIAHMDKLQQEGFLYESAKERITVLTDPGELLQHI
jgi:uncharacterized protein (TIGR00730 family)